MARGIVGILGAAAIVAGCASMDKEECVAADWYAVGLEDGARGRALERLGEHRRACAEHGVTPHTERYLDGRSQGLKSFCTYERGFSEGRAGHRYVAGCPEPSARAFQAGYQRGHVLHDLDRRLQQVQEQIRQTRAALNEGVKDPRERARQVDRLEALSRESEELKRQLAAQER